MKQTITLASLDKIVGRFILELNSEADATARLTDRKVDKQALEFYLYKRIRFVSYGDKGITETDLFGNSLQYTKEAFINKFNDYSFEHDTDNKSKGTRYHRLLYSEELDIVFDFLKKRNY